MRLRIRGGLHHRNDCSVSFARRFKGYMLMMWCDVFARMENYVWRRCDQGRKTSRSSSNFCLNFHSHLSFLSCRAFHALGWLQGSFAWIWRALRDESISERKRLVFKLHRPERAHYVKSQAKLLHSKVKSTGKKKLAQGYICYVLSMDSPNIFRF